MKSLKALRAMCFVAAAGCLCVAPLAACSTDDEPTNEQTRYVISISQTQSDGEASVYTITYSDGTTSQITVPNGSTDTDDDGDSLNIEDIWEAYVWEAYVQETDSDLTLAQFIEEYLSLTTDYSAAVSRSLLSCVSIYAEFVETTNISSGFPGMGSVSSSQIVQSGGSGVIYSVDDDYVYIVTNYHVIYYSGADASKNGGTKTGRSIYCYLYGSEDTPTITGYDEDHYYTYDYGEYAIECEYVGGSLEADIAVLRADKEDVFAINDEVQAVTIADGYSVGETVFAIGNAELGGISVTTGVVSVDSEYISLDIDSDGNYESYRSIRFDATIYSGNSGGGLFNAQGELIGINNAGNTSYDSICYAIPYTIVTGTADNIIYYAQDGDDSTNGVYKQDCGMTLEASNARYVLGDNGTGQITEEIYITAVTADGLADQAGLAEGDRLISIIINGTEYELTRTFNVDELLLTVRQGDAVSFVYERDGTEATTQTVTIAFEDLEAAA